MNNMTKMIGAMLDDSGMEYTYYDDDNLYVFGIRSEQNRCVVSLKPEEREIVCDAGIVYEIPQEAVNDVLELLMRINTGLTHGRYDYIFEEHIVCYTQCQRMSAEESIEAVNLIGLCVGMAVALQDILEAVCMKVMTVKEGRDAYFDMSSLALFS